MSQYKGYYLTIDTNKNQGGGGPGGGGGYKNRILGHSQKLVPKYGDRKRKCIPKVGPENKCIPKVGTGKEIGSQKWGPEGFLPVPSFESKILFRSLLLRYIFFSGPRFWNKFFFQVPISEIHFSFQVPNSETHTLSLEFGQNMFFVLIFKLWVKRTLTQESGILAF